MIIAVPVCRRSTARVPGHAGTVFFTEKSYNRHRDFKKIF
ncbi:hypothetical protein CLOHYLEM_05370 [[Clostridium] hylemonae DSM 15053]|uniref:Uncharacterized protein n=1 Tax=[Clostridium] hylemonae DSM 15053 TaxID=553973 RepID=C0BZX8_9FIRM|nr:hypothetical protein CLOHYLEM_05370 [[Clostridium] hylemonae DSM 15053]